MATRRLILKKTKIFPKGGSRSSATVSRIKKYLKDYMDERGKNLVKHGEFPLNKKPGEKQKRKLLPEELEGKLYLGGFLGKNESPGHQEPNKQKGWINRVSERWVAELNAHNRRPNDGFRFILSLAERAEEDLQESDQSPVQALLSIWEKASELYRQRHGWDNPAGEMGWVCGAHHDTEKAHIHLLVFPTTKGGIPLKTNYRMTPEGKENHLMEMQAIANIAAEIHWRETLGFEYQDKDYQKAISIIPTIEPPLPNYKDFDGGKADVEKKGEERKPAPKISMALIAREMAADTMIGLNGGIPIKKPRRRGLRILRSIAVATPIFETPWMLKMLRGKGKEKIKELTEKFPDEYDIIQKVADELTQNKHLGTRALGTRLSADGYSTIAATLSLNLGNQPEPNNELTLKTGIMTGRVYEKNAAGLTEEAAKKNLNNLEGPNGFRNMVVKIKVEENNYRNALRRIAKGNPKGQTAQILKALIVGAGRLADLLESICEDIKYSAKNKVMRDWSIIKNEMVQKESMGAPWPIFIDPETVMEPLKKPDEVPTPKKEIGTDTPQEIAEAETAERKKSEPSTLKRFVRIIQPREMERRRLQRDLGRVDPKL